MWKCLNNICLTAGWMFSSPLPPLQPFSGFVVAKKNNDLCSFSVDQSWMVKTVTSRTRVTRRRKRSFVTLVVSSVFERSLIFLQPHMEKQLLEPSGIATTVKTCSVNKESIPQTTARKNSCKVRSPTCTSFFSCLKKNKNKTPTATVRLHKGALIRSQHHLSPN